MVRDEKQRRAIRLCEAARSLVERAGSWRTIRHIPVRTFEGHGFSVIYRTVFQRMPINEELVKLGFGSRRAQLRHDGLYGLDIWSHPKGKVLNVIWNDPDGQRTIVTFRRGEWEELFLRLVSLSE